MEAVSGASLAIWFLSPPPASQWYHGFLKTAKPGQDSGFWEFSDYKKIRRLDLEVIYRTPSEEHIAGSTSSIPLAEAVVRPAPASNFGSLTEGISRAARAAHCNKGSEQLLQNGRSDIDGVPNIIRECGLHSARAESMHD